MFGVDCLRSENKDNKQKDAKVLTSFEESYLRIIEKRENKEPDNGFEYIPDKIFAEDFQEDEEIDEDPENALTERDINELEAKHGHLIEVTQDDGTTVTQTNKMGSKLAFKAGKDNKRGSVTNQEVIALIYKYSGVKKFIEKELGVTRKTLNWYIHKRSPEVKEAYFKVIGDDSTRCQFVNKPTNDEIGKALMKARGVMSKAARELNVSYTTFKSWIEKSKVLTEKLWEAEQTKLDIYESKLDELAEGILVKGFDGLGRPSVYDVPPNVQALKLRLKPGRKEKFGDVTEINKNIHVDPIKFIYIAPSPPDDFKQIDGD